jgi:DNA-binding MarR family transcriptional regulator
MRRSLPSKAEVDQLRSGISTLIRVFHVNEKAAPAAEGQTKYSPYDFQTLGFVAEHPGCMATALATYLVVSPTTATSIVDRLVKRGLLSRERPQENRRAISLTLTAEGRSLHQAIIRQDMKNVTMMLQPLTADERATFLSLMSRIVDGIRDLEDRSRS